ncbi:MAG: transposase [Patescibacteria group bacterium]
MNKEKPQTGEIYHIYIRGVEGRKIFPEESYYTRYLSILDHYLNYKYPFSLLKERLEKAKTAKTRNLIFAELEDKKMDTPEVKLICFCLMPTHPHLTAKQLKSNGISNLMHRINTSYTNYFNIRNERTGRLFESSYRLKKVESDDQLLHLTRYQHINPRSLGFETAKKLLNYPWSSLSTYLGDNKYNFVEPEIVLNQFSNPDKYLKFVMAEIDEYEPLRLEGVAIDDDFGWFSKFRRLKNERKKELREFFLKSAS